MTTKSLGAFVIEREIRIDAPRDQVFSLLADREAMRRWFRPSIFEPRPGGRVEFVFPFDGEDSVSRGEITAYDPPSRVAYTWAWQSSPEANTEVTFELVDEGGVDHNHADSEGRPVALGKVEAYERPGGP